MTSLQLLGKIDAIPAIHGRSAFALELRRQFLARRYAAVAVELPPSLLPSVEEAVKRLPTISCVVYEEAQAVYSEDKTWCYVPIDPCDAIIEAVRLALAERIPIHAIDSEEPLAADAGVSLPDEHALHRLGLEAYVDAVRPVLPLAEPGSPRDLRERHMAVQLKRMAERCESVLFVGGLAHLEGIRRALESAVSSEDATPGADPTWAHPPEIFDIRPRTLVFALGELPFQTAVYERCRASIDGRDYETVDGLKELLIEARKRYGEEFPDDRRAVSPQALQTILTYIRNLCLVQSRLTPCLYEIIVAAKGVLGGPFARVVAETARDYPFMDPWGGYRSIAFDKHGLILPDGERVAAKNRLPGRELVWREIRLDRPPERFQKTWKTGWNPFAGSCSWPPEDLKIEGFAARARQRAREIMTRDLAKVEKFQSSLHDGIDLRETLRHSLTGPPGSPEIYVRIAPPAMGGVGAVVFVFDEDDARYPMRMTWHAEHQNESTIACYATEVGESMVGPGIARCRYGGSVFIFPPLPISDIWDDPFFDRAENAVERIALAALVYSQERAIAYVAAKRPSLRLREAARKAGRRLVFLPLSGFSPATVAKLRIFHVLNGKQVRSYAARFIR